MSERKLVGTGEMFKKALAGGYAIGAYNVNNMEILQAIAEAAEETRSPIILQVSAGARKYANQTYLVKLVEAALETTTVPIALHLDHGADFEICKACIDGGFSSVMIDGSRFSFEENVAVTKNVSVGSILIMSGFFILYTIFAIMGDYNFAERAKLIESIVVAGIIAGLAIFRHRANIKRLIAGTENKLSFSSDKKEA